MASLEVTLQPMTQPQYVRWYDACVTSFAKDKMAALDISFDDALKLSKESFQKDLPKNLATRDNYFFSVFDTNIGVVGNLWLAIQTKFNVVTAYIYDIEIFAEHHRKGFGEATMKQAEIAAIKRGATKIGLHVFGDNIAARALYEKFGYRTTDLTMTKDLGELNIKK